MKVLNNNCRNDISDQECYHCSMNGHITECPEKCEQFEPVMSQELMDHYKALSEHYNNKASRIVMEAYMLGQRDARKQRDSKQGDLISRQAVLDAFSDYVGSGMSMNDFDALWDIVVKTQPVNPQEPKTGHWIDREEYDADRWKCSECGRTVLWQEKFCPNCGAKMEVSE